MATRNLYIRQYDEPIWDGIETLCKKKNVPVSTYVSSLLRAHYYQLTSRQVTDQTPAEMLAEAQSAIERALISLGSQAAEDEP